MCRKLIEYKIILKKKVTELYYDQQLIDEWMDECVLCPALGDSIVAEGWK